MDNNYRTNEVETVKTDAELKAIAKRKRAAANRKAREAAMRSCGLVKVRGELGGTYWE